MGRMSVRDGLTLQILQRFPLDLSVKIKVLHQYSRTGQVRLKQAKRLVARGLARWEGDRAIRMVESVATAIDQHMMRQRAAETGYDRIDRLFGPDEIRGLPVIHPEELYKKGTPWNRWQPKSIVKLARPKAA
jgi:hypothetical protein